MQTQRILKPRFGCIFLQDCGYITLLETKELLKQSMEVGKLIDFMIRDPEKFGSDQLPTATAN